MKLQVEKNKKQAILFHLKMVINSFHCMHLLVCIPDNCCLVSWGIPTQICIRASLSSWTFWSATSQSLGGVGGFFQNPGDPSSAPFVVFDLQVGKGICLMARISWLGLLPFHMRILSVHVQNVLKLSEGIWSCQPPAPHQCWVGCSSSAAP